MSDEKGHTPEELARLGLAGAGNLPRIRIPVGEVRPFLAALRPPWPGLGRTVVYAVILTWIASSLPSGIRNLRVLPPGGGAAGSGGGLDRVLSMFAEGFLRRIGHPLGTAIAAARAPWLPGMQWFAAPLSVLAGVLLLRGWAEGRNRVLGLLFLAAGLYTMAYAVFDPSSVADGVFPGPVAILGAATVSAWLLFRAADPARDGGYRRAAPGLALAALIGLNLSLLLGMPGEAFAYLFGRPWGPWPPAWLWAIYPTAEITAAVLGTAFLLLPALVVRERLRFRAAIAVLGRALRRRPGALVLAHLLVLGLAVLPIGELVRSPLVGMGVQTGALGGLQGAFVHAIATGIPIGLLVYATSLTARALVATEPPRRAPAGPPPSVPGRS